MAQIMVPLKYLRNFRRTLEMSLINYETIFLITDTKLNDIVVTLSTQHNAKILEQLKSGFKQTINWNKQQ